jgi:Uroporphyrinogen decarboxylase (URO-D)
MPDILTPRKILDSLLKGTPPPRPLFLPIVFSLGARMENVSLRAFLGNPTKISNSLRLIRGHLRSDGVVSYFDPYLEAEALGALFEWEEEDQRPTLRWSGGPRGVLPEGLRSPEEALKAGRIGVATDVIRRLRSMTRDESLIAACLSGPFTLATRLTGLEEKPPRAAEDFPDAALDLAASMMTTLSTAFVEAGANLIFVYEEVLPHLSAESAGQWESRLTPAANIARFHQALTVLLVADPRSFAENSGVILEQDWNCVVCPALDENLSLSAIGSQFGTVMSGIALPLGTPGVDIPGAVFPGVALEAAISELHPVIVTTAGDFPPDGDIKGLVRVAGAVRTR